MQSLKTDGDNFLFFCFGLKALLQFNLVKKTTIFSTKTAQSLKTHNLPLVATSYFLISLFRLLSLEKGASQECAIPLFKIQFFSNFYPN